MSNDDQIDDLLDQWEDYVAKNPAASASSFVDRVCTGEAKGVASVLLEKINKLQRILPLVDRLAGSNQFDATHIDDAAIEISVGSEPVPGYVLRRMIAAGGYGEVWEACGPGDFTIAMKFVRLAGRGTVEKEALKIAKRARHPNLVVTHGAWDIGGYLIIAMELAERTLFDVLEAARNAGSQGIPREELLRHMADAAAGIDYLNDPPDGLTGIQHRDIKPQNLLIVGGRTKVADFGIARIIHGQATGHTGAMTIAYAAPEFFERKTTNRSDQYSLAVTYCYLLTGTLPFHGSDAEVMHGHLHKPPDLSGLPRADRAVVNRAMAKKPEDRWPSCEQFVRALESHEEGISNHRLQHRKKISLRVIAVVCLCVATLAFGSWSLQTDSKLASIANMQNDAASVSEALASTLAFRLKISDSVPEMAKPRVEIVMEIDESYYSSFISSLSDLLERAALKQGRATVGISSTFPFYHAILRHDLLDASLNDAIEEALQSEDKCVIVLAKQVGESKWGEQNLSATSRHGGHQMMDCIWFKLQNHDSEPIQTAFRRLRSLTISVDDPTDDQAFLKLPIRPFAWDLSLGMSKTQLLPGGPVGRVFSTGMGGGDLNVIGARSFYEKTLSRKPETPTPLDSERVMIVYPGFFQTGQFVEQVTVGTMNVKDPSKAKVVVDFPPA
jgi:serine/threonine protein kinase